MLGLKQRSRSWGAMENIAVSVSWKLLLVVSSRVRRLRSLEDIPERRWSALQQQWIFSSQIRSEWVMSVFNIDVTVTHDWWMPTLIGSGRSLASVKCISRPEGSVSRNGLAEMRRRRFQRRGVVSTMLCQQRQTFLRVGRHEALNNLSEAESVTQMINISDKSSEGKWRMAAKKDLW